MCASFSKTRVHWLVIGVIDIAGILTWLFFFVGNNLAPTQRWRSAVTRCDVFVDTSGKWAGVGEPGRWGAWWALDGGDTSAVVRELTLTVFSSKPQLEADNVANLNRQVEEVQGSWYHGRDGRPVRFRCHLTGALVVDEFGEMIPSFVPEISGMSTHHKLATVRPCRPRTRGQAQSAGCAPWT